MPSIITHNDERRKFVSQQSNLTQRQIPQHKSEPLENHIWGSILKWTNVNETTNPLSQKNTLSIPVVKQVRPEALNTWKTRLEHSGYKVDINKTHFNVSMHLN
jgi:hypothetical protein